MNICSVKIKKKHSFPCNDRTLQRVSRITSNRPDQTQIRRKGSQFGRATLNMSKLAMFGAVDISRLTGHHQLLCTIYMNNNIVSKIFSWESSYQWANIYASLYLHSNASSDENHHAHEPKARMPVHELKLPFQPPMIPLSQSAYEPETFMPFDQV